MGGAHIQLNNLQLSPCCRVVGSPSIDPVNPEQISWGHQPPLWMRESEVRLDYPNGPTNVTQISMSDAHASAFALQHTLLIPAQVSTLTYTQNGMLILGSGEFSHSSTGCTTYLRKMTGVFDCIAHLTLRSLELFEDSTPESHRRFLSRRTMVASVTYG